MHETVLSSRFSIRTGAAFQTKGQYALAEAQRRASYRLRVIAVVSMIACLGSKDARAQTPQRACAASQLQVEGAIGARWVEALGRLCGELGARSDLDRDAVLRLRAAEGDQLNLHVTLRDGRSAERLVRTPDELLLAVEALLAVPELPQPPSAASTPPPQAAPQLEPNTRKPEPEPAPALGVEVTGELMVRLARAPSYGSPALALFVSLLPEDWWLGLTLRWEPGQSLVSGRRPPDFEMDSVATGLIVGRRLQLGNLGVLLGGSALIVDVIQSSRPIDVEDTHTAADVRFGLVSKLLWGKPPWRLAISLDVDVSPARVGHELHLVPALPALPSWSAGVGAGVAWGQP